MLIFVILIRHINTKLLKSCSESQKLIKVAKIGISSKVAQKLPSTICLGLQDSLGFWILATLWIPDSRYKIKDFVNRNLDSEFSFIVGFRIF